MGLGPIAAIPKVLAQAGLSKEDIDVWEVCFNLLISVASIDDTARLMRHLLRNSRTVSNSCRSRWTR